MLVGAHEGNTAPHEKDTISHTRPEYETATGMLAVLGTHPWNARRGVTGAALAGGGTLQGAEREVPHAAVLLS